jgi:Isochorismatase family
VLRAACLARPAAPQPGQRSVFSEYRVRISFLSSDNQDSSSVSGHAADFRAGRAMGHAMDGTGGGEYREPVSKRTVFTRFITSQSPGDVPGMWQRYYSRWRETTRESINPALLELLPPLSSLSPPATIIDKTKFSGFVEPQLLSHLQARDADGLVITGSETDVCVLRNSARWPWTLDIASSLRRDLQFFRPRPRCTDGGLSFALFGAD